MIDTMIRCKNLIETDTIETIHEWFYKCPPKGEIRHWKDGRSAKETAKYWLHTIPHLFQTLLKQHNLKYSLCSPEYVSHFDVYKGEARNHDLLIIAKNETLKPVVISIESKADESFGDTVSKRLNAAQKKKLENPRSKACERIEELRWALFGELNDNQLELRYQLLTAVAGTIAEAKNRDAKTAFFLVQAFVEKENHKHQQNKKDLDHFINKLSKGVYSNLENNQLLGPFTVAKATEKLPDDIELYIGKFEIQI